MHTWLPLAHTEAPDRRLGHPRRRAAQARHLRPAAARRADGLAGCDGQLLSRFLGVLCLIGIIYGALVAWVQQDIKKLVAYSSVSHLGFCVLGLVALNTSASRARVLYMINHGLSHRGDVPVRSA